MNEAIGILEGEIDTARRTIEDHQEHIASLRRDGLLGNIPKWEQDIADIEGFIRRIERAVDVLRKSEARP